MAERRLTNSELRRQRSLAVADQDPAERGILELFDEADTEPLPEDAPLAREAADSPE